MDYSWVIYEPCVFVQLREIGPIAVPVKTTDVESKPEKTTNEHKQEQKYVGFLSKTKKKANGINHTNIRSGRKKTP